MTLSLFQYEASRVYDLFPLHPLNLQFLPALTSYAQSVHTKNTTWTGKANSFPLSYCEGFVGMIIKDKRKL